MSARSSLSSPALLAFCLATIIGMVALADPGPVAGPSPLVHRKDISGEGNFSVPSSLSDEIQALREQQRDTLGQLTARLKKATDELEIQSLTSQISQAKREGEIQLMVIKARHARRLGKIEMAKNLERLIIRFNNPESMATQENADASQDQEQLQGGSK